MRGLVLAGACPTTRITYSSLQQTFANFCRSKDLPTVPCSTRTINLYITWLKKKNLSTSSIRQHIAAVKHLHHINDETTRFENDPSHQLLKKAALKGNGASMDKREPLTVGDLKLILAFWASLDNYDSTMLSAALCLGFSCLLRVGEFSTQRATESPRCRLNSISFKDDILALHLYHSKGDRQGTGVDIAIPPIHAPHCPVSALTRFLNIRRRTSPEDSLFCHEDGKPMTGGWFREQLKLACNRNGITKLINGHSIRIGAATHLSGKGAPLELIKRLGRWKSDSVERYLRPSREQSINLLKNFLQ